MAIANILNIRTQLRDAPYCEEFVRATNLGTLDAMCTNVFGQRMNTDVPIAMFESFLAKIVGALPLEYRKVQLNKARIFQLYRQASVGKLSTEIFREARIPKHQPLDRPKSIIYSQIEEASAWVFGQSTTNQATGAFNIFENNQKKIEKQKKLAVRAKKQALTDSMWNIVSTNKLVTSRDTLDYIHGNVGITNNGVRAASGGSMYRFYGGTAIGRYLHSVVSQLATNLCSIANQYAVLWYDVAAMMMVGYIICHGFADGNGRASRAIYGITLVQKRLHFIAPSTGWLNHNIASQFNEQYGHPESPEPAIVFPT